MRGRRMGARRKRRKEYIYEYVYHNITLIYIPLLYHTFSCDTCPFRNVSHRITISHQSFQGFTRHAPGKRPIRHPQQGKRP